MLILIVDDDEINLDIIEANLDGEGYEIMRADDGAQALEMAGRHRPNLIITDILMPNMDGYKLCHILKADAELRSIPVIFYSATYTDSADQTFALDLGAARFLVKPQSPDRFQQTIREVLDEHNEEALLISEGSELAEPEYLQRYNQRLISKLEDKLAELDSTNRRLAEEVSRAKAAESKVHYLAYFDMLTGLPNRVGLLDHARKVVSSSAANQGNGALLVIEISRFWEINHTLGHNNGKELLQRISGRLEAACGAASSYLARIGDDRFALVLAGMTKRAVIAERADLLVSLFEPPIDLDGLPIQVPLKIGISLFPEHGHDAAKLLRHAEVALYQPDRVRERVSFYTPETDPFQPQRLCLVAGLRTAIREGELVLHYQPKIELPSGRAVGAEALVRWQHPQLGLLPPARFIRLAEQTGQIRPLTSWVLGEAVRELVRWQKEHVDAGLCLNLSTRDLLDEELPAELTGLLQDHGLQQPKLTFEMTESVLLSDPHQARASLDRLADMGVKLAIDDFGTGYSSLSHLRELPVKELKIDRSFVINMGESEHDTAIVRSTIDLGHNLDLEVTAEGIENQQVLDTLTGLGCDMAQGYYIARPMPARAVRQWLRSSAVAS